MANVYVNTCSDTAEGQKWNVMADGRIAVEGSTPREYLPTYTYAQDGEERANT